MIKSLGIVPAAGKAARFGGTYKEMLPISNDQTLIKRVVQSMSRTSSILIVTSKHKNGVHQEHLSTSNTIGRIQTGEGLWSAILEGLAFEAEHYYFAMPDTYYNADAFTHPTKADFSIWTHQTYTPDRFGMIVYGKIIDKPDTWEDILPSAAWGLLSWSKAVRDFWLDNVSDITTHTQAFNMAICEFSTEFFDLDYYYDIASWDDYQRLVKDVL